MENNFTQKINPVIVVAVFVQIVFVIVAVVSIKQILESNQPKLEVNVTGLTQEIPGLPESGKEKIEYYVYQAISDNSPGSNISKTGVNIREGSLINKYYENANIHYVNFIADIPEAEQSYQVAYEWSDDAANKYISPAVSAAVTCLDEAQLVYGNFDCDRKNDNLKQTLITMIIRAMGGRPEEEGGIYLAVDDPRDFKVKINYFVCDTMCLCERVNENRKQQALTVFDNFIEGLGYNSDSVPHYFYNCEDEAKILDENGNAVWLIGG